MWVEDGRGLVETRHAWIALRPNQIASGVDYRRKRHRGCSDHQVSDELSVAGMNRGLDIVLLCSFYHSCHSLHPLPPAVDSSLDELKFREITTGVDMS